MGDFGVPIAIVIMVMLDYGVKDIYTEKLFVPEGLQVSKPEARGWFISPVGNGMPFWIPFVCVIPAMLAFILLFIELSICE